MKKPRADAIRLCRGTAQMWANRIYVVVRYRNAWQPLIAELSTFVVLSLTAAVHRLQQCLNLSETMVQPELACGRIIALQPAARAPSSGP